jgi:hypothetical protein
MLIPRERGCQYKERRDTDVEECDTEGAGIQIPRESDTNAEREQCRCQGRAMPMPRESNAETKCYQVMKPITQQQSVWLANQSER